MCPVTAKKREGEPILAVARAADRHAWLASHHGSSRGLFLRIAKPRAQRSITYAEALDVALAWGWIDSQKRALDANAWLQRFTPRQAKPVVEDQPREGRSPDCRRDHGAPGPRRGRACQARRPLGACLRRRAHLARACGPYRTTP